MVLCLGLGHILEPDAVFSSEFQNRPQPPHAHFFPDPFIGQAGQIESGPGTLAVELLGKLPADAPDLGNRRHFQSLAPLARPCEVQHPLRSFRCLRNPVCDLRKRLRFGNTHAYRQPGPLLHGGPYLLTKAGEIVPDPGEIEEAFVDGICFC